MIDAAILISACSFAALVGALLIMLGYELGKRTRPAPTPEPSGGLPAYVPPRSVPSPPAPPTERRKPIANSDEKAWELEREEREGKRLAGE